MKNATYILASLASLAIIILVISYFRSKAGMENEKKQIRELEGIDAQINLLIALKEAYHLDLNVDSISKAAFAVPGSLRRKKIGELTAMSDSIRKAHK